MPTGGVKAEAANLKDWFSAGVCCVGMGSDLVRKAWLDSGDYAALTALTRSTLDTIRSIRES